MPTDTEELVSRLRNARTIVVLTGSGVSAASGIPTFRGDDGLWRTFRAEELATPEAFAHDPKTVWEWYDWRRARIASSSAERRSHGVGELEPAAGIHADHPERRRPARARRHGQRDPVSRVDLGAALRRGVRRGAVGGSHRATDVPAPHLPLVRRHRTPGRRLVRGEHRPRRPRGSSAAAAGADVFLSIGTSSLVFPAAGLLHHAKRNGAFTVEINPGATDVSRAVDLPIAAPAEAALAMLDARVRMG